MGRVICGEVKIGEIMLYAVFENGGKQYKAVEGEFIEVDLLPVEIGSKKTFDKVLLLVNDTETRVGSPLLSNVSIDTTVIDHIKGDKIKIFKYRPKQRYRVKTGHRQQYTRLQVNSIAFPGRTETVKSEKKVSEPEKAPSKKQTASKTTKKNMTVSAKKASTTVSKSSTASKNKATPKTKKTSTLKSTKASSSSKKA